MYYNCNCEGGKMDIEKAEQIEFTKEIKALEKRSVNNEIKHIIKRLEMLENKIKELEENKSNENKTKNENIIRKVESKNTTQKTFRIDKNIDKELKSLIAPGGKYEGEKIQNILNTILLLGLEGLKNNK